MAIKKLMLFLPKNFVQLTRKNNIFWIPKFQIENNL